MAKAIIIYQSKEEEVYGKHLRSKEWIMYSGRITIYDRQLKPVVLKLKSEIYDSFIAINMDDSIEFSGKTITEVYQKLNAWFRSKGVVF